MIKFEAHAPNKTYTKEFLRDIRENNDVIYDPRWAYGVRIVHRKSTDPLVELIGEYDGTLRSFEVPVLFSMCFCDSIIEAMTLAKSYWKDMLEVASVSTLSQRTESRLAELNSENNSENSDNLKTTETTGLPNCADCQNIDICKYYSIVGKLKKDIDDINIPDIFSVDIKCRRFDPSIRK